MTTELVMTFLTILEQGVGRTNFDRLIYALRNAGLADAIDEIQVSTGISFDTNIIVSVYVYCPFSNCLMFYVQCGCMRTFAHVRVCVCVCVRVCVCACVRMCVCVHAYLCACVLACVLV